MKKIFVIFVTAVAMSLVASCGCGSTAAPTEVVETEEEVLTDSTATVVDTVDVVVAE